MASPRGLDITLLFTGPGPHGVVRGVWAYTHAWATYQKGGR